MKRFLAFGLVLSAGLLNAGTASAGVTIVGTNYECVTSVNVRENGVWDLGTGRRGGCAQNKAASVKLTDIPANRELGFFDDYGCSKSSSNSFYLVVDVVKPISSVRQFSFQQAMNLATGAYIDAEQSLRIKAKYREYLGVVNSTLSCIKTETSTSQ